MTKTIGELRVRTEFNPSKNEGVDGIKQKSAELINTAKALEAASEDPEVKRLCELAATAYEEGAMWLVKAATAGK